MDTNSYRKVDFLEKLFAFIPGDLQHLTDIFLSSLSDQTQDFWGWDWWESEKYDDDTFTFYHPDVEEKLVKLFSIKALKILGNMEDTDISRISLVVPPDKVYILRDDRTLLGFLSSIEGNQERLSSVLNSKDIGRIVFLKKILRDAASRVELKEREDLRRAFVDNGEIEKFRTEVVEGFNSEGIVRETLKSLSSVENLSTEPYSGNIIGKGISNIEIKEPFVKDIANQYALWGKTYGGEMAAIDSKLIYEAISKAFTQSTKTTDKGRLFNKIGDCINKLGNPSDIVIFSFNFDFLSYSLKSKHSGQFVPSFVKDLENHELKKLKAFEGLFLHAGEGIPVFEFYIRQEDKELLIFDRTRFGRLIQYSPLSKGDDTRLQKDILKINVRSFSEDPGLIEETLTKLAPWVEKDKPKERREEYLMERVLIQIYERFIFKRMRGFKGYRIRVEWSPA